MSVFSEWEIFEISSADVKLNQTAVFFLQYILNMHLLSLESLSLGVHTLLTGIFHLLLSLKDKE